MSEEKYKADMPNNIILEGRSRLSVTGVTDVGSFDEQAVVLETTQGMLIIHGSGLHMERLSLDSGEAALTGTVDALEYQQLRGKSGLFSRLFG